jgi:hypothetical protein
MAPQERIETMRNLGMIILTLGVLISLYALARTLTKPAPRSQALWVGPVLIASGASLVRRK